MPDFMKRGVVTIATRCEVQVGALIVYVPNITARNSAVWVIGISGTPGAGIGSCGVGASEFANSTA